MIPAPTPDPAAEASPVPPRGAPVHPAGAAATPRSIPPGASGVAATDRAAEPSGSPLTRRAQAPPRAHPLAPGEAPSSPPPDVASGVAGIAAPVTRAGGSPPVPAPGRGRSQTPAGGAPDPSALPAGSSGEPRTFTIELPPGLKLLSLNQRLHWAERNRRTQALKKAAWIMALKAKIPRLERVVITAEHQPPPDGRHRDGDNYAPSAKAATDGIVAAGVLPGDDKRYVTGTFCTIGEPYPRGRLVLHLTEAGSTGSDAA